MKWHIKLGEKMKGSVVDLPDTIIDREAFEVTKDGQTFLCVWHRNQSTLFVREAKGGGERIVCSRGTQVASFREEPQISIESELKISGCALQTYQGTGEVHIPGIQHKAAQGAEAGSVIRSPMAGKVLAIKAHKGDNVDKGDPLVIIEAMKMENIIRASRSGHVGSLHVSEGDQVAIRAKLCSIV